MVDNMTRNEIEKALATGELTEVRLGNPKTYPCSPAKNKKCKKTNCYIYGGECDRTTKKKYRR